MEFEPCRTDELTAEYIRKNHLRLIFNNINESFFSACLSGWDKTVLELLKLYYRDV
jgi:hypothetical protein